MRKEDKGKYGIESLLDINLTLKQREYLGAFNWQLDTENPEYIGTGRSFLMAVVFIGLALERRNHWIIVFDHFPFFMGRRNILNTIMILIKRNARLLKCAEFSKTEYKFRIKDQNDLQDP